LHHHFKKFFSFFKILIFKIFLLKKINKYILIKKIIIYF
jgi:hypothetical protein